MSNILVVMNDIPYPPSKNGVCSTFYNLIRCWAKQGESVDVIYLNEKNVDSEAILYNDFRVVSKSYNTYGNEIFTRLYGKLIFKPRNCWKVKAKSFDPINCEKYDYIILSSLSAATVVCRLNNIQGRIIFFEADSGLMYYSREYDQTKTILRKIYLAIQKCCVAHLEKILYRNIDRTVFVSNVDCEYVKKRFRGNFDTTRIAVDVPIKLRKEITLSSQEECIEIGFSGIMDYDPNSKAVDYIIDYIIPGLEKMNIQYRIHLIGKNPLEKWKTNEFYKEGKIIITGYVDSVEEYLKEMDIYISPLFLGSGMKNKILQAMGVGVPIICSEVSAEGITELINGENCYIISKSPGIWCEKIKELAKDIEKRRQFSDATKLIIESNYSWNSTARKLLGDECK